jgi:hypothetical protein
LLIIIKYFFTLINIIFFNKLKFNYNNTIQTYNQNYNPINWKVKKNIFFIKFTNTVYFTPYLSFQFFNALYLHHIFKINIKEKNFNSIDLLPKIMTKKMLFESKNSHYKEYNIKYLNEILHIFLINLWLKNSKNICKFFKNNLNSIHFKNHRKLFLFYFYIFDFFINPNFNLLQIKGITLKFKGKLGKGGNSRKKTLFYKKGSYSLSNKNLALNRNSWNVWTQTGSVGCTFQIFYIKYGKIFKFIYIYLFINFNSNSNHII